MTDDPFDGLRKLAAAQFREEKFQEAVAAEVARLRAESDKSLWQRLLDKLPFTITRKNR